MCGVWEGNCNSAERPFTAASEVEAMSEIEKRNRIEDVVGLPEPEPAKHIPWPLVFIAGLFLGALIDMIVRTLAGL
jgi:hypothetical protein